MSWGVLWLVGSFLLQFPTGVESELPDVCKAATAGGEEEAVTELDAADIPGVVCI